MSFDGSTESFDIFISYNWDVKDKVKLLYNKLTNIYKYKVWIDDNQLTNDVLYDQLVDGIKKSTVILCCITKKYSESENCVRELTFSSVSKKPLVILMFEKLLVSDLGSVGFIITPLTRFNCYNDKSILTNWEGEVFLSILKSVNQSLSAAIIAKNELNAKNNKFKFLKKSSSNHLPEESKLQEDLLNYTKLIENDPNNKVFLMRKAEVHSSLKQYDEAIACIDNALKLDPGNQEAKKIKIHALHCQSAIDKQMGRLDESISKINQALELEQKDSFLVNLRERILRKSDTLNSHQSEALENAASNDAKVEEKAIKANKAGDEEFQAKKYKNALLKYNKAIENNPREKLYLKNKAETLICLKKFEEALQTVELALNLDPHYDDCLKTKAYALYGIASHLKDKNKNEDSLIKINEALQIYRNDVSFYICKLENLIALKKYDEACKIGDAGLEKDPENFELKKHLAMAYNYQAHNDYMSERPSLALIRLDQAVKLDPAEKIFYVNKADILINSERFVEAIEELNNALKLDPNNEVAKKTKIKCLNSQSLIDNNCLKYQSALDTISEAVDMDPKNKISLKNKAFILGNMNKHEEGLKCIDLALKLDSNDSENKKLKAQLLNSIAMSEKSQGKLDEALSKLNKAIQLDPSDKILYKNKAVVLNLLERYEEATQSLNYALKLDPYYEDAKLETLKSFHQLQIKNKSN